MWVSRTTHDAELTGKIEACGFNVVLNTDSTVHIFSVTAFCRDLLSTYFLKEGCIEHRQPKNLWNPSQMLLKDHLSVLPILPSLFHWCCVGDWFLDSSEFTVGLCCSLHPCHALLSRINLTLGDWKPKRWQDLRRETSLVFQSARSKKHLFRAEQRYRPVLTAAGRAETQKGKNLAV